MRYLARVVLVVLGGLAYWFCGQGIVHKMWRPLSVMWISTGMLLVVGVRMRWWMWFITQTCIWASLTTYYKWGGQENVELHNWIICGFMYGMAALPVAITQSTYKRFIARCLFLAGTLWLFTDDGVVSGAVAQEVGRGMMYVGTLMLLERRRDEDYIPISSYRI